MATNSIEEELRTLVKSLTGVTAYIGTGSDARIYFIDGPEDTLTMPYITYFTVAATAEPNEIGQEGGQPLVQFSVWDDNKENGLGCANALVDGLNYYAGTPDTYRIDNIIASGPATLRDPNHERLYQFIVEADIEYDR